MSRQIVFAIGVKARHLRGLAADEGAAVRLAGVGEARDHAFGHFGIGFGAGQVIEEEERVAPCTAISFTQWLTRFHATIWCKPSSKATFSLVPTPSAELTGWGSSRLEIEPEKRAKAADSTQELRLKVFSPST